MRSSSKAALGTALALAALEVGLQIADPARAWRDELVPQQVSELDIHRLSADVELLYELVPDLLMTRMGPYGEYTLSTTSRGFRGGNQPDVGGIMVLGGSNTFGPGVGDHEAWPVAMRSFGIDEPVYNLGVSGYMTRQKVAFGRKHLDLEPRLVLIQVFNTGRRFVLNGTVDEAFSRWPQLYSEFFRGPGLWGVATVRTAVLGWNRANQQAVAEALYEETVVADAAAVNAFVEDVDVPVFLVIPAAGGDLPGVDLPTIDLSSMDPPDTEIHPEASGHRWAAERVAAAIQWHTAAVDPDCPWTPEQLREAVEVGDRAGELLVVGTEEYGLRVEVRGHALFVSWYDLAGQPWCEGGPDEQGCFAEGRVCPPREPGFWVDPDSLL